MYAPTQPYQSGRSAGGMRAPYPNPQQMAYPVAGHPQAMYAGHPQQQQHFQQPRYPQHMAQGYPAAQQQAMYQQQHHGYPQQQQQAPHSSRGQKPHKGTLAPGQIIKVGKNKVRIEKYLSEGGYAHVYLTTSEQPIYPPNKSNSKGFTEHCLKRVAFQDENVWKDVRKEIEVMKMLPASPYLVQYLDSSWQRLPNGAYEVFILMECCKGGGIIDLLNQRLRDRLSEREILQIFTDVCEAVAAMHSMEPRPLLHRDLKIENVLSAPGAPTKERPQGWNFKLCDFGSTTYPSTHPPTSLAESEALALDINKHTTMQYRSPEMVEPMLGHPVGLPSDVWALGVLLYKLCYYTTPFETQGPLAIVHAKYEFPPYPKYSPALQHLIAQMLLEHPSQRLSVFQVLEVAHDLNGTRPSVDYSAHKQRMRPLSQQPPRQIKRNDKNPLDFTDPSETSRPTAPEVPLASTVQPQRRGRPTRDPREAALNATSPQPMATHKTTPALQRIPSVKSSSSIQSMPTPPASHHPDPRLPSGAVASAKSKFEQQATKRMSLPHRSTQSPVNRLQVTGEDKKNASRKSSVDAFGFHQSMPKVTSPLSFGDSFDSTTSSQRDGFSDAFGLKVNKPPQRQFTDAFKPTPGGDRERQFTDAFNPNSAKQRSVSAASGFSDSFSGSSAPMNQQRSVSGFSDSFTSPRIVTSPVAASPLALSPQKLVSIDSIDETSSSGATAEDRRSPASNVDGDTSFETRFPSVEALHRRSSASSSSYTSKPKGKELPQIPMIKDEAKPSHIRRTSVVANRTGGDLPKNNHHTRLQQPQPRSTQVTGTAFKSQPRPGPDDGLEPPATGHQPTPSPTADYLDLLDDEETTELLAPTDLMDEEDPDEEKLALKPMKPEISKSPNSGARFGMPAKKPLPTKPKPALPAKPQLPTKPQGAAERAALPELSSARPPSNFNSDNWSPLESAKEKEKPTQVDLDSSDEEEGPEDPVPWRRTESPLQRRRPSPDILKRMSSFEPAPGSPTSPTSKTGASAYSGYSLSGYTGTTASTGGSLRGRAVSGVSGKESHSRRSSVIDMKTHFELLNTGSNTANGAQASGSQGHARHASNASSAAKPAAKPAKPEKPATLRRLSGPRPQPKNTGPKPPLPPTPVPKPAALRKGSASAASAGPGASGAGTSPTTAMSASTSHPTSYTNSTSSKPAVKHAEAPSSLAYSKSSSGRAFPVAPKGQPQHERSPERPPNPRTNSHDSTRSSSPEKPIPVKDRIGMWNKGEVRARK